MAAPLYVPSLQESNTEHVEQLSYSYGFEILNHNPLPRITTASQTTMNSLVIIYDTMAHTRF